MQLLTFRIIGHPRIADSSWLQVSQGLNVLKTWEGERGRALLRMLQTLNPPYDCLQADPFAGFPVYASAQQYARKIIPAKKTVALALYAASPTLVTELAALDPVLYETDRIELGRRRDYSRWTNFVELAGSSRWSEIAGLVHSLLPLVEPGATRVVEDFQAVWNTWRGSDRIKDQRALVLQTQLQTLQTLLPEAQQNRLAPCFQAIARARHFSRAKAVVAARLPLFLTLNGNTAEPSAHGTDAGAAQLAFLAARLRTAPANGASEEQSVLQLNRTLRTLFPVLRLRFRTEGTSLFLESSKGVTPCSFTALPPAQRVMALIAGLAVLHEALYACPPIFLLDGGSLNLNPWDQADLLKTLHRFCAYRQCLLTPDSALPARCGEMLR